MEINKKFIPKLFLIRKIFFIIIFFISSIVFLKVLTYDYYPDFSVYYYGTSTFINGGNPYLGGKEYFAPFVYPPTVLLFFLAFTLLPFIIAQKVFTAISLLCLFISIGLMFKLFKTPIFATLGLFLVTLVFNFFPEKFTLGMGQINNVMLLLVVLFLYFYFKKREYLSGVFLACAIALKLFPILLIPYLFIDRRWRTLSSAAVSLLVIGFVVYLFVNQTTILYFFNTILPGVITSWKVDYYNQSLSGFLIREWNNPGLVSILRSTIGAVLILISLIIVWKFKKNDKFGLLSISLLITLSLIVNTFSWQHHFVWMLIPLLITFFYIKNSRLSIPYYIFLGLSYLSMAVNMKNPSSFPIFLQSHVLYGALLLYILDTYLLLKKKN